jgi:hypothetical protein
VTTDDVKAVAHPVLRHRVITNFNAESSGITPDKVIDRLLDECARSPPGRRRRAGTRSGRLAKPLEVRAGTSRQFRYHQPAGFASALPHGHCYPSPKVSRPENPREDQAARRAGAAGGRRVHHGQHRSPVSTASPSSSRPPRIHAGDDIKHIDWKVWSKTDRLYIKEYEEETNLKCTILLDCSKSMRYGGNAATDTGMEQVRLRRDRPRPLAYLAAAAARRRRVGDVRHEGRKNLPASSHPSHLKLMLHELQQTQARRSVRRQHVFPELAKQIRRRGMIVLVSDLFVDPPTLESLKQFRLRKHEVIVLHVMHEDELTFPFQDNTLFRGMEMDVQLHTEPRACGGATWGLGGLRNNLPSDFDFRTSFDI